VPGKINSAADVATPRARFRLRQVKVNRWENVALLALSVLFVVVLVGLLTVFYLCWLCPGLRNTGRASAYIQICTHSDTHACHSFLSHHAFLTHLSPSLCGDANFFIA